MNGVTKTGKPAGAAGTSGASGYLTIDLSALARNYERLAADVAPARAAAVVKADAYGLGAHEVAPKLQAHGCRHFFVAQFAEALALRPLLAADAAVFVLNGLQPGNVIACAREGIVPVINSLDQWRQWAGAARSFARRLPAVLQFDTGMSRLGVPPEERAALAELVKTEDGIDVLFVMSHLASADDAQSDQNAAQLAEMNRVAAQFPNVPVCFANSGGIFLGKAYHGVLARPGIAAGATSRGCRRATCRPAPVSAMAELTSPPGLPGSPPLPPATPTGSCAASRAAAPSIATACGFPLSDASRWTASPSTSRICRKAAFNAAASWRFSVLTRASRMSRAMPAPSPTRS